MSIKPENAAILKQSLLFCAYALTACVAAGFGYRFGEQIGGTAMGLIVAGNSAVFSWLVAAGLADQASRLARRLRP